ncbi:MAG: UDP-N-acetylmuramoyl-L-alanine--D-glutamate ligase [Propionibacterium sp.]|nr:UDP-N-acetylmuramoyl-L-alanine--D-glutamate ligase [Propionibacterium sp.]
MGGRTVTDLASANRLSDWSGVRVVVAGLGVSGFAAADGLLELGARVTVLDDSTKHDDKAELLRMLDATVVTGPGSSATLPEGTDLVVTSPGWRPGHPLLAAAHAAGIPVWGEVELAWRMQQPDRVVPWLGVTGTNGKTTTTQMLTAILRADGYTVAEVGNIGRPLVEAILDDETYDVFVVELSSFQLHYVHTLALHSAAVLNVHEDHLEWYEGEGGYEQYRADKAKIYERVTHSCVYNVDEPVTEAMVEEADVTEGARAIGFTLGTPARSMMGVVDDLLVDRAFVEQRATSALELAQVADVQPYAPHNVANALAAAALARSFGARPKAVLQGLRDLELAGHRIQQVAESDGVRWIDDSKATNPHAADSAMTAFEHFVWIGGGQAKGTSFDELVRAHHERMRAAILFGVDRHVLAEALARHAPEVPVHVLDSSETGVMDDVVRLAGELAREGDVVLLSPGGASLDMFDGYAARGEAFAESVAKYLGRSR